MSSFSNNVYLPITLDPHELNFDLLDNIKNQVMLKYLHKELSGVMPKIIKVVETVQIPLGELINNQILIHVPCEVTYKYYKIGDIVQGTLTITDDSDISVFCGDLICKIYVNSGTVSYDDKKYCFIKNDIIYTNGSQVTVELSEARPGAESLFVFLGDIIDK